MERERVRIRELDRWGYPWWSVESIVEAFVRDTLNDIIDKLNGLYPSWRWARIRIRGHFEIWREQKKLHIWIWSCNDLGIKFHESGTTIEELAKKLAKRLVYKKEFLRALLNTITIEAYS